MKIVQINATCDRGSTGKICSSISRLLTEEGIENYVLYSSGSAENPTGIKYASVRKTDIASSRVLGNWGFEGTLATRKLIRYLDEIQPDIIHLHNIHNHTCRIDMLFGWIKKHHTKVFWTFHDCWAFTGYCMHFDGCGCQKWKTECHSCPQKASFSWFFDRSRSLHKKKLSLLQGVDMHIITPSEWLAKTFCQSPFAQYPVTVINNGIDLDTFCPTESDIPLHGAENKFIVLGVASIWEKSKGYDDFLKLAEKLDDRFLIVLVGQATFSKDGLPDNVVHFSQTASQSELAAYYSAADVFVNPTREDTFPTVNIEALACGTPVLMFDVGGGPEIIDESCGQVVKKGDIDELVLQVKRICEEKPFSQSACRKRAEQYDMHEKFREYIALYKSVL